MSSLLLQTSGILLPVFLFSIFNRSVFELKKSALKQKMGLVSLLALSILGCMSFAVPLNGYHYDMRNIPLFLGVLYGGYDTGIALALFAILLRFYIGGTLGLAESFESLLVYLIVLPFVFLEYRRFVSRTHKERIWAATRLGFLLSAVGVAISITFKPTSLHQLQVLELYAVFIVVNTAGMAFVVFLIEKSRENEFLKQSVHASEKLEVLSELAASVAHEVRQPLTVISGLAKLLTEDDPDTAKKDMYGQLISEELARTQSIINDYLTFAQPQTHLNETVRTSIKTRLLMAIHDIQIISREHKVSIEMDLAENLYVCTDDEQKFEQALSNILKNSIEAMPYGGTVTVCTRQINRIAVIDISDEGVGMSEEQVRQLGNPFYSLSSQGTGLGLMVAYRVIESIGGRIEVTTESGKGTCFTITVPIAEDTSTNTNVVRLAKPGRKR